MVAEVVQSVEDLRPGSNAAADSEWSPVPVPVATSLQWACAQSVRVPAIIKLFAEDLIIRHDVAMGRCLSHLFLSSRLDVTFSTPKFGFRSFNCSQLCRMMRSHEKSRRGSTNGRGSLRCSV